MKQVGGRALLNRQGEHRVAMMMALTSVLTLVQFSSRRGVRAATGLFMGACGLGGRDAHGGVAGVGAEIGGML